MQVKLEVVVGDDAGVKFTLDRPGTVIVGRKDADDIKFQVCARDRRFSRYHFMLEATSTACFVRDLGSCNGTFVNGKRVRNVALNDGDLIHSGNKTRFVQFRVNIDPLAGGRFSEPSEDQNEAALQTATDPLAGGRFSEPSEDFARGESDVNEMKTLPIGKSAGRAAGARVACPKCGESPPEDAWIHGLLKTGIASYVCAKHCPELTDARHPIPNYEVLEVLGKGAVGPVYKARRMDSGQLAVLKVVSKPLTSDKKVTADGKVTADEEVMNIFQRHMRLSAQLRNPHIAQVIEMGQAGNHLWLATEFVQGLDAEQLRKSLRGPLPLADAVDIMVQVLSALDCLRSLNLVHRDVKPSNILVSGTAGHYAAKLADFMLVKNTDEALLSMITGEQGKRGTVAFMAPEQVRDSRSVKHAADIYGAGATLYWLLTGKFVYDFAVCNRHGVVKDPYLIILEDSVIPVRQHNPAVPEAVARVIEKALQRDPEERFETAKQMADELRSMALQSRGSDT